MSQVTVYTTQHCPYCLSAKACWRARVSLQSKLTLRHHLSDSRKCCSDPSAEPSRRYLLGTGMSAALTIWRALIAKANWMPCYKLDAL